MVQAINIQCFNTYQPLNLTDVDKFVFQTKNDPWEVWDYVEEFDLKY